MRRNKAGAKFEFKPFSIKQQQLIYWPDYYIDCDTVIADGSIRSGKTIAMIVGFFYWILKNFYGKSGAYNFILAGRSAGALKRNVINPMRQILNASVTGIPITILFGRSAAGLNATGDGDLENYYTLLEGMQENKIQPVLEQLLPIMCMSEFGAVPDDLKTSFNPVRIPTEKEKAENASSKTTAVIGAFSAGATSQKITLKELRAMSDGTGMWSNITDVDIKQADAVPEMGDVPPEGEQGDTAGMTQGQGNIPPKPGDPQGSPKPAADAASWSEADHPRADNGEFGSGGGSANSGKSINFNTPQDVQEYILELRDMTFIESNQTMLVRKLINVNPAKLKLACKNTLYNIEYINGLNLDKQQSLVINSQGNDYVNVNGWAVDSNANLAAGGVFLDLDGKTDVPVYYGTDRKDVADYFKNDNYRYSGFYGFLTVSSLTKGQHTLSIKVVTADKKGYYQPDQKMIFTIV